MFALKVGGKRQYRAGMPYCGGRGRAMPRVGARGVSGASALPAKGAFGAIQTAANRLKRGQISSEYGSS